MRFFDQYKDLRKEIYILFIGRIVTRFGSMILSMLTLILNQKLGYSASTVSVFMILFSAASALASFLGGKLADRYNKKNIIIVFDCISIALYLACAFIPLSRLTIILIVAAAASQWAEHPAYNTLIADITVSKDREVAYALQYLGTNIGMMAAPTIAGFLFKSHLGLLFIISGVAIGISTVLIFMKVQDITPISDPDRLLEKRRDGESLWTILKSNKLLLLYLFVMGLYVSGYDQYNYLMPLEMGRLYGEEGAFIYGTVSSFNCITVIICSSVILSVFARVRPIRKILIAEILMLSGFVVFLRFIDSIPAYYLAMLLFTLGEIFGTISDSPYMAAHSPASHRGRINGFSTLLHQAMNSVFILILGKLYDKYGNVSAWYLVFGIIALAIVLTIYLNLREKDE